MPTISITKQFIIKDTEALEKLEEILSKKSKRKPVKSVKYKEGKRLLKERSTRKYGEKG